MTSYLAWVTECEHRGVGYCRQHPIIEGASGAGSYLTRPCPGGSVTRIEPDYEAAARERAAQNYGVELSDYQWSHLGQTKMRMTDEARAVVDASLGEQ